MKPMPGFRPTIIKQVQTLQKRNYLSVKDGYLVALKGGYGIIDGKGEVGSLVTNRGNVAGIVVQVGHNNERGYLKMVLWDDLPQILKKIKMDPPYLGISVTSRSIKDGVTVMRIAANSPLK